MTSRSQKIVSMSALINPENRPHQVLWKSARDRLKNVLMRLLRGWIYYSSELVWDVNPNVPHWSTGTIRTNENDVISNECLLLSFPLTVPLLRKYSEIWFKVCAQRCESQCYLWNKTKQNKTLEEPRYLLLRRWVYELWYIFMKNYNVVIF